MNPNILTSGMNQERLMSLLEDFWTGTNQRQGKLEHRNLKRYGVPNNHALKQRMNDIKEYDDTPFVNVSMRNIEQELSMKLTQTETRLLVLQETT